MMDHGDPSAFVDAYEFMAKRDPIAAERATGTFDRDVAEMSKALSVSGKDFLVNVGTHKHEAMRGLFYFAGMGQTVMDTVIWHAAYEKAMLGKQKGVEFGNEKQAIDYAINSVERSQGSGRMEFLPQAMREGGELHRMLFMFYTPLAAQLSQHLSAAVPDDERQRRSVRARKSHGGMDGE